MSEVSCPEFDAPGGKARWIEHNSWLERRESQTVSTRPSPVRTRGLDASPMQVLSSDK
jgi:hypothetical protein